jgi:hypothetical protein
MEDIYSFLHFNIIFKMVAIIFVFMMQSASSLITCFYIRCQFTQLWLLKRLQIMIAKQFSKGTLKELWLFVCWLFLWMLKNLEITSVFISQNLFSPNFVRKITLVDQIDQCVFWCLLQKSIKRLYPICKYDVYFVSLYRLALRYLFFRIFLRRYLHQTVVRTPEIV